MKTIDDLNSGISDLVSTVSHELEDCIDELKKINWESSKGVIRYSVDNVISQLKRINEKVL